MLRLTDPSHFVAPAAKKRKIGPETFTGPDMSADIRPKAPVAEPNTSRAEKGAVINKEEEEEDDGDEEEEEDELEDDEDLDEEDEDEKEEEDEGVDDEAAVKTKAFRGRESKVSAAGAERDDLDNKE